MSFEFDGGSCVFGGGTNGLIIQGGRSGMLPLCCYAFCTRPKTSLHWWEAHGEGEEVKGFTYRVLHAPSKNDLQGCAKYKSAREPKHTMFHWLILAHIIFQAESREHDPRHPSSLVGARVHAT